mgnify:CR=1 FL=1
MNRTLTDKIELQFLMTSDSITVYFDKPEKLPKEYQYEIFLNGKSAGESDKMHFLLEGLDSGTDYGVQIKVMSQGKELAKSDEVRVHTSAAGKRLDVTKAPYMAAGDGSVMDTQAIQKAIND